MFGLMFECWVGFVAYPFQAQLCCPKLIKQNPHEFLDQHIHYSWCLHPLDTQTGTSPQRILHLVKQKIILYLNQTISTPLLPKNIQQKHIFD